MKFYSIGFLAIVAVVGLVTAKETCTIDGKTFKMGETYLTPGACLQTKCVGQEAIASLACPSLAAPPHCKHIPQDNSKTYPECCEKYEC